MLLITELEEGTYQWGGLKFLKAIFILVSHSHFHPPALLSQVH